MKKRMLSQSLKSVLLVLVFCLQATGGLAQNKRMTPPSPRNPSRVAPAVGENPRGLTYAGVSVAIVIAMVPSGSRGWQIHVAANQAATEDALSHWLHLQSLCSLSILKLANEGKLSFRTRAQLVPEIWFENRWKPPTRALC